MVMVAPLPNPTSKDLEVGARLVATDGRALPLRATKLTVRARGGIAEVVLEQTFANAWPEPLSVTYQLPLPHDGAVSGYAFTLLGERIRGEVDKKRIARERFERAIREGHTAALLEEVRGSVFTQEVGNVPPESEVKVEVVVDQRLAWLGEGMWEWRFPTVVAPRFSGAPGRVVDADRLMVDVAAGPIGARATLELAIADAGAGRPESPSHPIVGAASGDGWAVTLDGPARLDRDVVVRWPVVGREPGASLVACRPSRDELGGAQLALITVVPPSPDARPQAVARDLILLLDVSGSMDGAPLEQARRVSSALVEGLGDRDRLEMIAFASAPLRFRREPIVASREAKAEALRWLRSLRAGGSTEMHEALEEALRPLRPACQRQIVLVTDGFIGFEAEVIGSVLQKLPDASRVHVVGVGSSVNRSLTAPVARAGAGVELIVGLGEDPDRLAGRLLARTEAPLVTELRIEGDLLDLAPRRLPDLYAGSPALISAQLPAEGGRLTISGQTASGRFTRTLTAPRLALGEGPRAVASLFGREKVEDLELQIAAGEPRGDVEAQIEAIGLAFQIATSKTSFVAVSEQRTVDPTRARRERMPHELPFGTSIEGLGLRAARGGGGDLATDLVASRTLGSVSFDAGPGEALSAPELLSSFAFDDDEVTGDGELASLAYEELAAAPAEDRPEPATPLGARREVARLGLDRLDEIERELARTEAPAPRAPSPSPRAPSPPSALRAPEVSPGRPQELSAPPAPRAPSPLSALRAPVVSPVRPQGLSAPPAPIAAKSTRRRWIVALLVLLALALGLLLWWSVADATGEVAVPGGVGSPVGEGAPTP